MYNASTQSTVKGYKIAEWLSFNAEAFSDRLALTLDPLRAARTGDDYYFLHYNGDLILELPENFKQLDANAQRAVKGKVTDSILLYLYEKYTAERNLTLSRVFPCPNGKTLIDPIRFVGNTWDRDIIPLRESLIRIQRKWSSLGHTVECPIDFSPEEIRKHHEDSEGWNEVQDFWDALSGIMSRDGWTSHATYDQAIAIYSQIQAGTARHSSHDV
ncbi:hypothetical protein BO82DRAFT_408246 [Aspergillus uvarum CBS 121591]|uniref:Phosphotransferase family protein n=1 Tax=Aspergillus uvarum CBS 121591 TaxID=1448315 RepID=A0A319D7Y6_9EURO|nr:hypothetical protein BO82DRAFT_408246 [Aspergillus uvarum CBS 121591]PYH87103.1 hypothetical protein BO82DRAFT_408246 [Aspergillus uvarum CBS 121591]